MGFRRDAARNLSSAKAPHSIENTQKAERFGRLIAAPAVKSQPVPKLSAPLWTGTLPRRVFQKSGKCLFTISTLCVNMYLVKIGTFAE